MHPLQEMLWDEYGGVMFHSAIKFIHIPRNNAGVIQAPGARNEGIVVYLDENRMPGGALFAINMLVNTEEGDCYTAEDVSKWYEQAGLVYEETIELTEQSRLVIGRKK